MKQLSFVDLFYLTQELNETLKDQRIDNFYYENETFYIRVYVRNQGHKYLTNKISKFIYFFFFIIININFRFRSKGFKKMVEFIFFQSSAC